MTAEAGQFKPQDSLCLAIDEFKLGQVMAKFWENTYER